MKRVMILGGAGKVASVISQRLKPDYLVLTADRQGAYIDADLSRADAVEYVIGGADLVVNCLPGALGFQALEACIDAGINVLDVSFMAESAQVLDKKAYKAGVSVLTDFGIAPGLSNILSVWSNLRLGFLKELRIYVGGFPLSGPYRTPFSPSDVIEEYTRPARIVSKGQVVSVEALSEPEPFNIQGLGPLEAFFTDGLRSLTRSIQAANAWEKTVRRMGHAESMGLLRQLGVFNEPSALKAEWAFAPGQRDITVMRIIADAGDAVHTWELLDFYHDLTKTLSMSRCTGIPAAMGARFLLEGEIALGVHSPEWLVSKPALFLRLLDELAVNDIDLKFTSDKL